MFYPPIHIFPFSYTIACFTLHNLTLMEALIILLYHYLFLITHILDHTRNLASGLLSNALRFLLTFQKYSTH